jgi:hypothetical protein
MKLRKIKKLLNLFLDLVEGKLNGSKTSHRSGDGLYQGDERQGAD